MTQELSFPAGGFTTLRSLEALITNIKWPSNRRLFGLDCVTGKCYPFVDGKVRLPSPLTEAERDDLAILLQKLPTIESGTTAENIAVFEGEYNKLPNRPEWTPVVIDYNQILANDEARTEIREAHRQELKRLILNGEISAVQWTGVRTDKYHPDHLIPNSDATKYLQWCGLIAGAAKYFSPALRKNRPPNSLSAEELKQIVEDDKVLNRTQIAKKYSLHPRGVHAILSDSEIYKKRQLTKAKLAELAKEEEEVARYKSADPIARMSLPLPVKLKKC
jgi:hypothetical protein